MKAVSFGFAVLMMGPAFALAQAGLGLGFLNTIPTFGIGRLPQSIPHVCL